MDIEDKETIYYTIRDYIVNNLSTEDTKKLVIDLQGNLFDSIK